MSENDWENFRIPYEKLSTQAFADCKNGNRNKESINAVVRMTVNAVRDIQTYVPCKVFKILAKKLINKFPKTFKEIDHSGVAIAVGFHSIYSKLMDRNNYLNRPRNKKKLSFSSLQGS